MKLERIDGIWISEHGRELLTNVPDFITGVWDNPLYRTRMFTGDARFTRLTYKDISLVEKTGEENEILRYAFEEGEIARRGLKNTRIAKLYFQKGKTLLMENLTHLYEDLNRRGEWTLNDGATEAFWELGLYGGHAEFAKDDDGNLIVFDPHCRIAQV